MIRKNGKLEEVSCNEAIGFVTDKLITIKEKYSPDAIMGIGSAREL